MSNQYSINPNRENHNIYVNQDINQNLYSSRWVSKDLQFATQDSIFMRKVFFALQSLTFCEQHLIIICKKTLDEKVFHGVMI